MRRFQKRGATVTASIHVLRVVVTNDRLFLYHACVPRLWLVAISSWRGSWGRNKISEVTGVCLWISWLARTRRHASVAGGWKKLRKLTKNIQVFINNNNSWISNPLILPWSTSNFIPVALAPFSHPPCNILDFTSINPIHVVTITYIILTSSWVHTWLTNTHFGPSINIDHFLYQFA